MTSTDGTSSSVIDTSVSLGVPGVTPAGRDDPKPTVTDSSSSSTLSDVAVNVNVSDVSPLVKVTFAGMPE